MRSLCAFILLTIAVGCSGSSDRTTERVAPRPVSVLTLQESDPAQSTTVTGVIGSWKTEDLGFEVSGRVQRVMETESNVIGPNDDGSDTQTLARIDPEKYETAVESARAQIEVLTRQKAAAVIEWKNVLPSQREAAVATQEQAQDAFNRGKRLNAQNAIAQAEFEEYVANLKTAVAMVSQINATVEAKAAEVTSLDAKIKQADAALKDAQRDLEDCTIEAPFRGQIARVHVIPGGTVQRGEPVLTLQMMDPMKVDFEVSAARARQMRYKDNIDIILTRQEEVLREEGAIWNTDSAADPSTRTFTITVLMRNRLVASDLPAGVDRNNLIKTKEIWKLVRGVMGKNDSDYVVEHAIHNDDDGQGDYLWKIVDNGDAHGPLFKVEKVLVTAGEDQVDFLNWELRDVVVRDGETWNRERDKVVGKLEFPQGVTAVNDTVLLEREQWLLRPGDLVGVDLSEGEMARGIYVPIGAITEKSGRHYVFLVVKTEHGEAVQQVEVKVADGPNTLKRVEAIGNQPLATGMRIVVGGVHYLTDGEEVSVAAEVESNE